MIGKRVYELREELGYTQEYLAELIGMGVQQINRYERSKTKPNAEIVVLLAKALHTSTDYLLGLTDDPTPSDMQGVALQSHERLVIAAMRKGKKLEAIKVIANEE